MLKATHGFLPIEMVFHKNCSRFQDMYLVADSNIRSRDDNLITTGQRSREKEREKTETDYDAIAYSRIMTQLVNSMISRDTVWFVIAVVPSLLGEYLTLTEQSKEMNKTKLFVCAE